MKWLSLPLIIFFMAGCKGNQISTASSQNVLGSANYYLSPTSGVRVYWFDSGLGTFISQIAPSQGSLTLPSSLREGDYEPRDDNTTARLLDLRAMVFDDGHPSGDFYFEAPFLGPTIMVSNVTTALSWYLRWGFGGVAVRVSQNDFDQMVKSIEIVCSDCRKKTNSDVLNLLLQNQDLQNQLREVVINENPTLHLETKSWSAPGPIWVWSSPILSLHGTAAKNVKELDTLNLNTLYLDPLHSTQKILPDSWIHNFQSAENSLAGGPLQYAFGYNDSGTHTFSPHFAAPAPNDGISYTVSVDDVNRNPYCQQPLTLQMRANTLNSIPLGTHCGDQDIDNTSLTYALSDGPYGLSVTTGGLVNWIPPSNATGTAYTTHLDFMLTDSKLGVISSSATIAVSKDNTPTFDSILSSYSFTEGSEGTITVTAKDLDGDPLNLKIVPVTPIKTGFPDGAGSLTNITRTGSNGDYNFEIKFTPSYLQTIGADGDATVKFILYYDNSSGLYDSTLDFDAREVTLHIFNTDDPPQWETQPTDLTGTENTDLGGLLVGRAIDPNPSPTTVVYSVQNTGDSHCGWSSDLTVTVDGAGYAYIQGMPAYNSNQDCQFYIEAKDGNQLVADSNVFTITTTNVNQPIVVQASAPASITGYEGKVMMLGLDQMFDDPDLDMDPNDPREYLTYNCSLDTDGDGIYESTCASQGLNFITGSNSLVASWTPPTFSAGTYHIQMSITDVGGVTATHPFDLIVLPYATAMSLSTQYGGVTTSSITADENSLTYLTVTATAASARAIDNYDFSLSTPTCSVVGGGSCSATLINAPGSLSGNGTTSFTFAIKPGYSDADSGFPKTTKTYNLSFYAQKNDDATVFMQTTASLTVNNVDRPPSAIEVTKGSFGCTGDTDNASSSVFTICVDASQDKKSGNSWSKTYSIPLNYVDPDGSNDSYSFSFADPLTPGSINGTTWSFKIPSCANASNGMIYRTYSLTLSDGRGGTVTRDIQLKIFKVAATSSCM